MKNVQQRRNLPRVYNRTVLIFQKAKRAITWRNFKVQATIHLSGRLKTMQAATFLSRHRKNKGMGAEKRGILHFRFLTSNETEKYQSKKLKIRPKIRLTQADFLKKVAFPQPQPFNCKKGQSGLICIMSSRLSKDFQNRPKVLQEMKTKI